MLTHADPGNAASPQPGRPLSLSRSPLPTLFPDTQSKRGYISDEKVSLRVGHK